jgi:hypothetical protein
MSILSCMNITRKNKKKKRIYFGARHPERTADYRFTLSQ